MKKFEDLVRATAYSIAADELREYAKDRERRRSKVVSWRTVERDLYHYAALLDKRGDNLATKKDR